MEIKVNKTNKSENIMILILYARRIEVKIVIEIIVFVIVIILIVSCVRLVIVVVEIIVRNDNLISSGNNKNNCNSRKCPYLVK